MTIPHLGVGLVLEMLSALIPSRFGYPALPELCPTTGTPGICSSRSSRTRENSPQESKRSHRIETDNNVILFPITIGKTEPGHFCRTLHVAMQFGLYLSFDFSQDLAYSL